MFNKKRSHNLFGKVLLAILMLAITFGIARADFATAYKWVIKNFAKTSTMAYLDKNGNMACSGGFHSSGTLTTSEAIHVVGGLVNANDMIYDAAAASTGTLVSADSISTATLTSGTTILMASHGVNATYKFVVPRAVRTMVTFSAGAATTTYTGNMTIDGTNAKGVATTETIALSTNIVRGVVAWTTISTMTLASATTDGTCASLAMNVGLDDKLGLSNDITTYTDIYLVSEAAKHQVVYSTQVNTTYDTYQPAAVPNATRDYFIKYKVHNR